MTSCTTGNLVRRRGMRPLDYTAGRSHYIPCCTQLHCMAWENTELVTDAVLSLANVRGRKG